MQIGVVFPQTEISADPAVVRKYAERAEELSFSHLVAYDHVLGADTAGRPDWDGPYTIDTMFHEVFVLFGYLAAFTDRIGLVTGVLILPQRQTALVAKQAAEVQVLSGGRFRLGMGVGWNPVEYEALGEDFHRRGKRSEEQLEVLRGLLTERSVTYHGREHQIDAAGINPLPEQPVPLWLGGYSDRTLRRVARLADGWICAHEPGAETEEMVRRLRTYTEEEGRGTDDVGVEGIVHVSAGGMDDLVERVRFWEDLGARYVAIDTMHSGWEGEQHVAMLEDLRSALAPVMDKAESTRA